MHYASLFLFHSFLGLTVPLPKFNKYLQYNPKCLTVIKIYLDLDNLVHPLK